ncbi:unnamed protein product [Linum trigynum]
MIQGDGTWRSQAKLIKDERGTGRREYQNPKRQTGVPQHMPPVAVDAPVAAAPPVCEMTAAVPIADSTARPTGRQISPNWFSVKSSPCIKIGGRRVRSKKSPRAVGQAKQASRRSSVGRAGPVPHHEESVAKPAVIIEEARRRRLILEEESEEESVEQGPRKNSALPNPGLVENLLLASTVGEQKGVENAGKLKRVVCPSTTIQQQTARSDLGVGGTVRRRLKKKGHKVGPQTVEEGLGVVGPTNGTDGHVVEFSEQDGYQSSGETQAFEASLSLSKEKDDLRSSLAGCLVQEGDSCGTHPQSL